MIQISDKRNCCGCTACASICPHKAITMTPDVMDFLYPEVDTSLCVECGLCEKVCQFHSGYERYANYNMPLVYGCRHKDEDELVRSQSGAASWAIMQAFLQEPGVVYGVGYESITHIVHKRATTLEECQEFRGSKYVQSDLRGIFQQVKDDLRTGRRVLFFGTGCQVSGLKSFLPQNLHQNLFTVDLVCHATPSPAVWKSFVEWQEKRHQDKAIKVDFRNKIFGWHSHQETITFSNGRKESSEFFFQTFYKHLIIRNSCFDCHFTNLKRVSDITIADYWGWEKHYQEWNDNKGVSLFLVSSEKGEQIFQQCQSFLSFIPSEIEKCIQPQLQHPVEKPDGYDSIPFLFKKKGFKGLARLCGYIPGEKYYQYKLNNCILRVRHILSRIKHSFS